MTTAGSARWRPAATHSTFRSGRGSGWPRPEPLPEHLALERRRCVSPLAGRGWGRCRAWLHRYRGGGRLRQGIGKFAMLAADAGPPPDHGPGPETVVALVAPYGNENPTLRG